MVRRAGRLVFRDRFCWRGPWDRATAAWHFGEGPAGGSLFVTGLLPTSGERQTADEPTLSGGFRPPLAKLEQAILPTADNDTCLRCLGSSEQVTACVVSAALQAAARLADPVAVEPWLSNQDLAPNHWFSVP